MKFKALALGLLAGLATIQYAVAQTLAQRVETIELDVNPVQVGEFQHIYEAKALIRPKHDGGALLIWEENVDDYQKKQVTTHITPLGKDLKRSGDDIVLANYWVYDALTHDDQGVVLTAGRIVGINSYIDTYPNYLYILKVNYDGLILWQTQVCGSQNQTAGDTWHDHGTQDAKLAFNGTHFSVYTPLMKDFAEAGAPKNVHQIDLFKVFDTKGKEMTDQTVEWSCSHSNDQRIVHNEKGDWITLTVGDGGPYGILAINRTTKERKNLYGQEVDEASTSTYPAGCGSTLCAGMVGNMYRINGLNYAIVGHCMNEQPTDYNQKDMDALLLTFDDTPTLVGKKWVTKDRDAMKQSRPYMAPLGSDRLLIGWFEALDEETRGSGRAWLMTTDLKGNVIEAPTKTDFRINSFDSNFQTLANGDVVWAVADQYETKLTIYRVRRQ